MRSQDRILTTHVGSLPRPRDVVDVLFAQDRGALSDERLFDETVRPAVRAVVARQRAAGVDIVSDGEMSKISYATYIRHRFTGFEPGEVPRAVPADLDDFPEYRDRLAREGATPTYLRPVCTGPITVKDVAPLQRDIARFRDALVGADATGAFMTAASPGVIAVFQPNDYYPTREAYLQALAAALKCEYEAIVGAGFLLQVDCPDLAMARHIQFRDTDDREFVRNAEMQVEALNFALSAVPAESVRMHLCWGNYAGPHTHDIPLERILPVVLKAKPAAIAFEAANPRHAHEWEAWRDAPRLGGGGGARRRHSGRQGPYSGGPGQRLERRGASPARGATDHPVRGDRRARTRDRGDRLRLRHLRGVRRGPSGYLFRQACVVSRWRGPGVRTAMVKRVLAGRRPILLAGPRRDAGVGVGDGERLW